MLSSYSYSALDTYQSCPRRFKFAYVDRVKVVKTVTADTYLGTAVHRILKKVYALGADGILLPLEDALEEYHQEWQKLDRKALSVTSNYHTVDDYIRIGREILSRHYERYRPFNQGTLLGTEINLNFVLEGTPFKFRSIIDRLWKRDDGTVEICDYKTG
ncbi:MAG: PD-(D/E)XK nuclease family protein, partial [Candidatus Zixiibacteriota bacterium]